MMIALKIIVPIGLILLSINPFLFALSLNSPVNLADYSLKLYQIFPFFVAIALCLMSVVSIWLGVKSITIRPPLLHPNRPWSFLLIGGVVFVCGFVLNIIAWYTPEYLGLTHQSAKLGAIIYNTSCLICAVLWRYALIMAPSKFSNITRVILLIVVTFGVSELGNTLSLILLSSFPDAITSYPYVASFNYASYLIWGCFSLILLVERNENGRKSTETFHGKE